MLNATRDRVIDLFAKGEPGTAALVRAVEGDLALTIAVMRMANRGQTAGHGRVDSVVRALEVLSSATVLAIAQRARTYDFFERVAVWQSLPERFRLHGSATQRAAERIASAIEHEARDRLMVTSMMHDVGKLVLVHAYPGYPAQVHADARTPEERVARERRELGVDHAVVGGVLVRRWGLPATVARAIETHHAADATGEAAIIRLADMLAHYLLGAAVAPSELLATARTIGLSAEQLRRVMYELPMTAGSERPRQIDPCPMSAREVDVLRRLAKGMVYKQIAAELGLSTSTVRTHLHNVYGKLGAMDRAQAVLIATEHGWI
jgi:DNA-binding CsgD family transcriptional regulator/HD-like signal output (HDOD) protein